MKPARTTIACLIVLAAGVTASSCTTTTESAGNTTTPTVEQGAVGEQDAPLEGVTYDGPRIVAVDADRALAGLVRTPTPNVGDAELPSLTNPGETISLQAQPGRLLAVYFGFTNCPDVCPTTLADLTIALRKLPDNIAGNVDFVMITVDPDRDNDILADYVTSFIPDAQAAGTDDAALLADVADIFGANYDVTTDADGNIDVEHTGFLYLVDDYGDLVVTWQFGAPADAIAADILTIATHPDDTETP